MMKKKFLYGIGLLCATLTAHAQSSAVASANDYLKANKKTDATVLFSTDAEGVKTPVVWGLDTAWPSEDNMRRGVAFIGKGQLAVARVSFQPSDLIDANGDLSSEQKKDLSGCKGYCTQLRP